MFPDNSVSFFVKDCNFVLVAIALGLSNPWLSVDSTGVLGGLLRGWGPLAPHGIGDPSGLNSSERIITKHHSVPQIR